MNLTMRAAILAATAGLAATGAGLAAAPASASSVYNIDQLYPAPACGHDYCLWYLTGDKGAGWGGNLTSALVDHVSSIDTNNCA
jgi:hypothetical protein